MEAKITRNGQQFEAKLTDGRVLVSTDPRGLARLLVNAGVHVDRAHCGDWREGDSHPGAGSSIALKVEMRRLLAAKKLV